MGELQVVTGAFGYTGRHIARRLLDAGHRVRTLTGHPDRPKPFGEEIEVVPYAFDDPRAMARSLRGAAVLYNTYWIRFEHEGVDHELAVEHSRRLVTAAKRAGVGRIVHVSITNPSEESPFPYFRGKAAVERAIAESGISHAIVRPTVIFGEGDVLINNIAWLLRRFPAFTIPGSGEYRLQPVHVGDVAALCVRLGGGTRNAVVDAAGPETFSFEEMVRLIAERIGSRAAIVHVPLPLATLLARLVGCLVRDVLVTGEELEGLMAGLVVSRFRSTCPTRLSEWLAANAATVGRAYASELDRHYRAAADGAGARPQEEVLR